jgi:hypothetical protein
MEVHHLSHGQTSDRHFRILLQGVERQFLPREASGSANARFLREAILDG